MLRQKWQDDLRQRFNIFAEIVDARELLAASPHLPGNPTGPNPLPASSVWKGYAQAGNWEDEDVTNPRAETGSIARCQPPPRMNSGIFDLGGI